jgi:hypothetical protein
MEKEATDQWGWKMMGMISSNMGGLSGGSRCTGGGSHRISFFY